MSAEWEDLRQGIKESLEEVFPAISTYTRAQALEEGVLVDVSETAKEAGVRVPIAVSQAVWAKYVVVPEGVKAQDEAGRLWDIIWMYTRGVKAAPKGSQRLNFALYVRNHNRERTTARDLVHLYATIGPGDQGEPVVTVMEAGED